MLAHQVLLFSGNSGTFLLTRLDLASQQNSATILVEEKPGMVDEKRRKSSKFGRVLCLGDDQLVVRSTPTQNIRFRGITSTGSERSQNSLESGLAFEQLVLSGFDWPGAAAWGAGSGFGNSYAVMLRDPVPRSLRGGMSDVTRILSAIEQGDPSAAQQLLPLVYEELKLFR
jgi:hypothetical protein